MLLMQLGITLVQSVGIDFLPAIKRPKQAAHITVERLDKIMNMLLDKSISELAKGLRKKEFSSEDLINEAYKQIEKIDKNAIEDSNEIILVIESYGNMPAKDILLQAIKVLEANLDYLEKKIK